MNVKTFMKFPGAPDAHTDVRHAATHDGDMEVVLDIRAHGYIVSSLRMSSGEARDEAARLLEVADRVDRVLRDRSRK